ncbi:MAG TPA: hypothetical protein VFK91_01050 [Methyloceanibacter sp.]|nr:hypothetical protein [Methyloceanibacter sp.]
MKRKTIEEVLERVKTWPEVAQADLAQAALGIEADLERGVYGETYVSTRPKLRYSNSASRSSTTGQSSR